MRCLKASWTWLFKVKFCLSWSRSRIDNCSGEGHTRICTGGKGPQVKNDVIGVDRERLEEVLVAEELSISLSTSKKVFLMRTV